MALEVIFIQLDVELLTRLRALGPPREGRRPWGVPEVVRAALRWAMEMERQKPGFLAAGHVEGSRTHRQPVHVDADIKESLRAISIDTDRSVSWLVASAIYLYLRREEV